MDVSVVIVSWNTREILRDCLQSIFDQTNDLGMEVIVVDNASTDGSAEMVSNEFPPVVLVANQNNRGFAAANNQGIGMASGRYVLLLNSDTVVLDNAVGKAVAFADDHPDTGIVGCRVRNADRTVQSTCFMYPSPLNMLLSSTYLYKIWPRSRFWGREQMSWWDRDDVRDVDVVTGCFMLVRRAAIEQVGVMDEGFFMYGEETDWCYRFKESGWRVVFTPDAEIIHLGGCSSRQMAHEMRLQLHGSILRFIHKHKGRASYSVACLLSASFFGVRVPYWVVRAVISRAGRRSCLRVARTYAIAGVRALCGWKALSVKSERIAV